jgi:hypothetical protein
LTSPFRGAFWLLAGGGAVLGGLVMSFLDVVGDGGTASETMSFVVWHVLARLILHFGRHERPDELLRLCLGQRAALDVHWRWMSPMPFLMAQCLHPKNWRENRPSTQDCPKNRAPIVSNAF